TSIEKGISSCTSRYVWFTRTVTSTGTEMGGGRGSVDRSSASGAFGLQAPASPQSTINNHSQVAGDRTDHVLFALLIAQTLPGGSGLIKKSFPLNGWAPGRSIF